MKPTVIVGASVAGMRTATALRMGGFTDPIIIVEAEPYAPYDKPPLSKDVLDAERGGRLVPLLTPEQTDALDSELRLGVRADGVDVESSTLSIEGAEPIGFQNLVIACGLTARSLPGADRLSGVHTIRSAGDALVIYDELRRARHAVVVGAGFIGAEFASAARARDLPVTIVEVQREPMGQLLGPEVGALMAKLHEANGVEILTDMSVAALIGSPTGDGTEHVNAVRLADGRELAADLVVVGIGAVPATGWLTASGLPLDNGLRCDANLQVIGTEHIYAAGDVARWPHQLYDGAEIRIEHWTNANDHASIVAASILGTPRPAEQVPYVWSDQYGRRIQIVGRPQNGTLTSVTGGSEGSAVALYGDEHRRLVGALTIDDPRSLMRLRKAIRGGALVDGAL